MERNIELKNVDYKKHPTELEEFLAIDADSHNVFNFQKSYVLGNSRYRFQNQ